MNVTSNRCSVDAVYNRKAACGARLASLVMFVIAVYPCNCASARGQVRAATARQVPADTATPQADLFDPILAFSDDKRLQQPITITAQRIYLGALLNKLQRRTGVSLHAELRDGAGDPVVTVYATQMKLGRLMDALWALVSYKGATWDWSRVGSGSHSSYTLFRPLKAQQLGALLQREMMARYLNSTHLELQASLLAKEKRNAFLAVHRSELFNDDAELRRFQNDDCGWGHIRMLAQALTPAQIDGLLSGPGAVTVPLSQLDDSARESMHQLFINMHERSFNVLTGQEIPIPEPQMVTFISDTRPPTPNIDLQFGGGGPGICGGMPLENWYSNTLESRWLLPGDEPDAVEPDVKLGPPAQTQRYTSLHYEQAIGTLARLPLNVVARVPVYDNQSDPTNGASTRDGLLKEMRNYALPHKWRRDTVLITNLNWLQFEPEHMPWSGATALAKLLTGPALEPLVLLASRLNSQQAERLVGEFPQLKCLLTLQPIASAASSVEGGLSALDSTGGVQIDFAATRGPAAVPDVAVDPVRMRFRSDKYPRSYLIQIKRPDGQWHTSAQFSLPEPSREAAMHLIGID